MRTTLITDRCYMCEYEEYCTTTYCCLKNSSVESIIDKTKEGEEV